MNEYSKRLRYRLEGLLMEDLDSKVLGKSNIVGERISNARKSFVTGYQKALKASKKELPTLLNDMTGNSRGFALEGAAMAVTMMDELDKANQDLLATLLSKRQESERMLCAIGIGWASARIRYPIQWFPASIFSKQEIQSIIDGYGFHQGFFGKYKPKASADLKYTAFEHEAYLNGIGRSIWFTQNGIIENIKEIIVKYPTCDKKALWSGVGTACAFTDNIDQVDKLQNSAQRYESYIYEGAKKGGRLLNSLLDIYFTENVSSTL